MCKPQKTPDEINGNYDRCDCERCGSEDGFWHNTVPNLTPVGAYLCTDCYYHYLLLNEEFTVDETTGTVYAGGAGPAHDVACENCTENTRIVTIGDRGWCRRCIEENDPVFWDAAQQKVNYESGRR